MDDRIIADILKLPGEDTNFQITHERVANSRHLFTLEIPRYMTKVKVSEKRLPKYYAQTPGRQKVNKCPARLGTPKVDRQGYYLDEGGNRIVANSRSAGSPRFITINAQVLYVGNSWGRVAIKNALEKFYIPFVETLPVFTGSIIMESEIHTIVGHSQADLDNLGYVYGKVLADTMIKLGKIVDDKVPCITKPCSAPLFFPVSTEDEKKFVYHFYQDLRPEILRLHK